MRRKVKIKKVPQMQMGGQGNSTMSPDDIAFWNNYVDYVKDKGYKGSPKLDVKTDSLSRDLYDSFAKSQNWNTSYEDFIPRVQSSIKQQRQHMIDDARKGKLIIPGVNRFNGNNEDLGDDYLNKNFMSGLSDIDGWAGSKTTSYKFPVVAPAHSTGFIPGETLGDQTRFKNNINYAQPIPGSFAYGGQIGYGFDAVGDYPFNHAGIDTQNPFAVSDTLQPVDRDAANVEAEKGETVVADFDQDGQNEHMNVGGKRHSEGGTPLQVPDNAFIFSDTKKMKMGGSELVPFGKSENTKKKYTPADLAKQYDINKYKAILDDPNSDPMSKKTAELMIDNYQNKLSQLALVQEAKKGFPQGIPEMAQPYLEKMQESMMPQAGNIQDANNEGFNPTGQQMAYGGQLRKYVGGGDFDLTDPYAGGKTPQGRYTPTKKDNRYNRGKEYLEQWEQLIPGISKMDNQKAQGLIYDYTLKNNPDAIRQMWGTYGLTKRGLSDPNAVMLAGNKNGVVNDPRAITNDGLQTLKNAYTDGFFGVRQLDPSVAERFPLPKTDIPDVNIDVPAVPSPAATITPPPLNVPKPQPGSFTPTKSDVPFDYMTPDKLAVLQGIGNRANLKKYMPWEAPVNAVTPTPTFYDPTRELANNNEQAGTQMMYNNQFSGPQSVAARNSQVAGQAASNAANIMSRYDNQNVQTANQFAGINADIMNKLQEEKARSQENLYNGTVIADQQYDNSKMKLDNDLLKSGINAWNNRSQLGMINDTNPYYYTDPATGRMVFKGGRSLTGSTQQPGTPQGGGLEQYDQLMAYASQHIRDPKDAHDWVMKQLQGQKATYSDRNMDGVPDSVRYQQQYNPIYGRPNIMPGSGY